MRAVGIRARCAWTATTAFVLVAMSTAPARAALPVTNGPIAYETGFGDAIDIAISNPDGSNLDPALITSPGADRDPAISTDGRQLAFTSTRDGNEEIYRSELDGTGQVNLTRDAARDHDPDWAPDGRIAFASDRAGGSQIFVMGADGGGVRQLTFGPGRHEQPSWSPDGREIAYVGDEAGNPDLYAVDAATGAVRRITDTAEPEADPSWGPVGAIAFTAGAFGSHQIFRIGADGTDRRQLTTGPADNHFPAWSPDGARIALTASDSIPIVDADRGEQGGVFAFGGYGRDPKWGRLPEAVAPPSAGETFTVAAGAGAFATVRPGATDAGGALPARVRDPVEVPAEIALNVSRGTATVTAATPQAGADTTTFKLSGGRFSLRQGAASDPPVLTFRGNHRAGCARSASIAGKHKRHKGKIKGKAKTKTGAGNAGSPGTEYTVVETCRGTRFSVQEGLIEVTPRRGGTLYSAGGHVISTTQRRVPVRVSAGRSFLAR
jgi:dipeptidyl aminopeptidase/acylaminoacyl peptidase